MGFNRVLGVEFSTVSPDEVVLTARIRPDLLQPYGIAHGGVWCALVETAGSVGAGQWYGERGKVVGVANHTDFLHSVGAGALVTATATPLHRGRLQQLWLVEIRDGSDRVVARGQLRLQNLPVE
jgi:1,4-dihydroxy-2-naphthoyl-CoA hydrolase